jgi:hypothetical protein
MRVTTGHEQSCRTENRAQDPAFVAQGLEEMNEFIINLKQGVLASARNPSPTSYHWRETTESSDPSRRRAIL